MPPTMGAPGRYEFPVPGNEKIRIYGQNYDYFPTNVLTSKIVVVGHSGLAVGRVYRNLDGYYPMPTK